ncbi:hypothetical protein [Streptomyces sp. CO7]
MLGLALLTGCAGRDDDGAAAPSSASSRGTGEEAKGDGAKGDGADPAQADYFACLADQGLPMRDTDSGVPVVDTAKADPEKVQQGEKACADKLEIPAADAKELAEARELTACMRRKGIADFPDPDPSTGDHALEELDVKSDPEAATALKECGLKDDTPTDGKVGG